MGFEPICAEDEVVCTDCGDVEFRTFLVEVIAVILNADDLNGG